MPQDTNQPTVESENAAQEFIELQCDGTLDADDVPDEFLGSAQSEPPELEEPDAVIDTDAWLDEPCDCDGLGEIVSHRSWQTEEYNVPEHYECGDAKQEDIFVEDWGASYKIEVRRFSVWRCPKCGDRSRSPYTVSYSTTVFKDELDVQFESWQTEPSLDWEDEPVVGHMMHSKIFEWGEDTYLVPERFEHVDVKSEYNVRLFTEHTETYHGNVTKSDKVDYERLVWDVWEDPETGHTYSGPRNKDKSETRRVSTLSDDELQELGIADLEESDYDEAPASVVDERVIEDEGFFASLSDETKDGLVLVIGLSLIVVFVYISLTM